jgi:hypothetical protein
MSNLYTNAVTMETMSVWNIFLKPNLDVLLGFWPISLHDLIHIIGNGFRV